MYLGEYNYFLCTFLGSRGLTMIMHFADLVSKGILKSTEGL